MSKINPNAARPKRAFFYASLDVYNDSERVKKGAENNDPCIVVTDDLDQCIALGGFGHIYLVKAVRCRHCFPPYMSISRQNVFGGIEEGLIDSSELPRTAHLCDEVEIVREIPGYEFFGPNGVQVMHVVTWLRSKWIAAGDFISPEPQFDDAWRLISRYYEDRLSEKRWPTYEERSTYLGMEVVAVPSHRFWLKPRALAEAWKAAYNVADSTGRVTRCRWLLQIPPLVALALRDKLQPNFFQLLWAPMESYFPLSTLDAEVRGSLYKA